MTLKFGAIFSIILFFLIGLLGIPLALTSVMLFDAPGSESNPYVWVLFFSALALPVTCFTCVITALIIFFRSKNYKKALLVAIIPSLVVACIVVNLILIQVFCQGNFACG